MKSLVFIIDPQSVSSLAAYDRCMVDGIRDINILFFGNQMYNDKPFNSNVKFIPIFYYNKYTNPVFKGLSYLLSIFKILGYALKERPSVAHFQWVRSWYIDWTLLNILKLLGTKIIFTVHNILPRNTQRNAVKRFKKLYQMCDILIAHTQTTKNDLQNIFDIRSSKIEVMPHGIIKLNVSEENIQKSAKELEKKFKFDNKIIFGSLGVQNPYKGTDLLINAWKASPALSTSDNCILLIAGKLAGIDIPTSLPENIVVVPRLLNDAEFTYLMRRIDVMILPYRRIEQSGVLLSLIDMGKPYCCTRAGELALPIEEEDVGWIIEECNEVAIENTLIEIMKDVESIVAKKNNIKGWKRIKDKCSWDRSNRILKEIYSSLIRKEYDKNS